jgi:hypothetical protein
MSQQPSAQLLDYFQHSKPVRLTSLFSHQSCIIVQQKRRLFVFVDSLNENGSGISLETKPLLNSSKPPTAKHTHEGSINNLCSKIKKR